MPEIEKTSRVVAPIDSEPTVTPASEPAATPPPAEPEAPSQTEMDAEEYGRLLDMYDVSFKNFAEGEVVAGHVLQVSESEVIVDVGYKSEGIIPIEEFRDEAGELAVKTGDSVDVLIEKTEDKAEGKDADSVEDKVDDRPKKPMVFPIYGRGRALNPYIGSGITADNLVGEITHVILAACTCTRKAEHPGVDLITHHDWHSTAVAMAKRF